MTARREYLVKSSTLGVLPSAASHSRAVAEWMSKDEVDLFLTSSSLTYPVTPEVFESYRQASIGPSGTHDFLEVYHLPSGKHIGHFELKGISERHRAGTLAHVVIGDGEFRGRGLGKEMCGLMARYAFEHRKLYRLSLSVHVCNRVAVAAYVAAGFALEGIIRDVLEFRGRRYSLYQMSLLKPEWEALSIL